MTSKQIRRLARSFDKHAATAYEKGDKVSQNGGKEGVITGVSTENGKQVYDVKWDGQKDSVKRFHGQLHKVSFDKHAQAAIEVDSMVSTLRGLAQDSKIVSPEISKKIMDLVRALNGAKPNQSIQLAH